jgi:quercetin dioxygenase-like cupin family protein
MDRWRVFLIALACGLLSATLTVVLYQPDFDGEGGGRRRGQREPVAYAAGSIDWKPAPAEMPSGTRIAVLEGNPRRKGLFTMRVKVPAGARMDPHWHAQNERVTVLSGSARVGFGEAFDETSMKTYTAGSFYVNPARRRHFLAFPEETVLQLTCLGPWEIHYVDVGPAPSR